MNVSEINRALSAGNIEGKGLFPHLELLERSPVVFDTDFGLPVLPEEPGILLIRGARQYGKSTWLEAQLKDTIQSFGPGSAFYLNGDEIANDRVLFDEIETLAKLFDVNSSVRRLFIDEITATDKWELALKRLADSGTLRDILVVTTGSQARDLRRGTERLPGRKGRLERTSYIFTPLSFAEFQSKCGERLGDKTLISYMLSGGSPLAARALYETGRIPEYVIETTRDWIVGETARSGRERSSLIAVVETLIRFGGSPVGFAKLARETGLANNTVAAGYIDLLADLLCVGPAYAWDASRDTVVRRKPAKFHFINLLAALVWYPQKVREADDFLRLSAPEQGKWFEWAVAQELYRRQALAASETPEQLCFWKSKEHEIDFVTAQRDMVEVKLEKSSALDFSWFARTFPAHHLRVVTTSKYTTDKVSALSLEEFLLG